MLSKKILLDNFYNNLRNLISSLGLSCDHYWRGDINEIHDFRGFWEYLRKISLFLHGIFFNSKIVSSAADKYQNFDYGCSSYSRNAAQSSDFGRFFWRYLAFFELFLLAKASSLANWFFTKNLFNVLTFTCSKRFFS